MEMKFGKHKGQELSEIPTDYLLWMKPKLQDDLDKFNNAGMVKEINKIIDKRNDENIDGLKDAVEPSSDGFKEPPAF